MGADAAQLQLELGLLARTFVKVVLSFIKTLVNNLHYSFGESKYQEGYETAHVVAPLFTTIDKIEFTPKGETPPPMGVPFTDDVELKKIRSDPTRCEHIEIIPGATYSFSLNSNNIDYPQWELSGVPMLKPLSLNMFTGGQPFSLVAYEVPRDSNGKRPVKHSCDSLKYILNMQMAAIDCGGAPAVEFFEEEVSDDVDGARRSSMKRLSSLQSMRNYSSNSNFELNNFNTENDDDSSSSCSSSRGSDEDCDQTDDDEDNDNEDIIIMSAPANATAVASSTCDDEDDEGDDDDVGRQLKTVKI